MTNSRVCNTRKQLEELILDVTQHDLNLQMQQLIADHRRTRDPKLLEDAEYLRSEFDTWWSVEEAQFIPPAQL